MTTNSTSTKGHTPGPWRLSNRNEICCDNQQKTLIAEVFEENIKWRGNARLIAASPEMFRMLNTASSAFSERLSALRDERAWRDDDEYRDMIGHYGVLKRMTDAVIRKAKTGK